MFATAGRTAEPNWLNKFGYLKNALARLGSSAELKYHKTKRGCFFFKDNLKFWIHILEVGISLTNKKSTIYYEKSKI